jgi:hypothetical protein
MITNINTSLIEQKRREALNGLDRDWMEDIAFVYGSDCHQAALNGNFQEMFDKDTRTCERGIDRVLRMINSLEIDDTQKIFFENFFWRVQYRILKKLFNMGFRDGTRSASQNRTTVNRGGNCNMDTCNIVKLIDYMERSGTGTEVMNFLTVPVARSEVEEKAIREVSDYLATLDIDKEHNDTLVSIMTNMIATTEREQFLSGVALGLHIANDASGAGFEA